MSDDVPRPDLDPEETREWVESLDGVLATDGTERARFLIDTLLNRGRSAGVDIPPRTTTSYRNTIAPEDEEVLHGDPVVEKRIACFVRWNAMAMVVRANRESAELGGHISSYASAANLYEVGFNHFFRAPTADFLGDLVYIQGHSSPGIYARAFLEGRLSEADLDRFRQEVGSGGLSSYPHPWLMPEFWQFPTVSMGLGPMMAIYQARFLRYLQGRSLLPSQGRKVWAFMGDGETDEPEALGAIALAAREKLDNLIFVVNCNLQRLDGPVRGNGKIIQELEGAFRGAGWNVIKVVWGRDWDPLLANDRDGRLQRIMDETVDGEYQGYKASGSGGFVREHFFGKDPEVARMVAGMSDDEIWSLRRGGHDRQKVFAAYHAATNHTGQPTVILAKTIKGYGLGSWAQSKNIAHNAKKLPDEAVRYYRDRLQIPLPDDGLGDVPYFRPADDSPEIEYLKERRAALGGSLPRRRATSVSMAVPSLDAFEDQVGGSKERAVSTTMAFVRMLAGLCRNDEIGARVVPIVADEARTFGMDGMFRQFGIYASHGQLYTPVDREQIAWYRESRDGQILQEGISEAGAMSSWVAAGTSYSSNDIPMIPFFIFYSMFGFQRVGDMIWAGADMRARGFLVGATSGRTTLAGEGLQHQDGHSHIVASTVPNCVAYDPAYAYELAVIVQDGLRRMVTDQENVFFYVTVMNENYVQPPMPMGVRDGILEGMYVRRPGAGSGDRCVQLLGSGAILPEVEAAATLLADDFDVAADVWSVTSFTELGREGRATERWNRLHPGEPARTPRVTERLADRSGPVIAATDYVTAHAEQIRRFVPEAYSVLGTDGFGRSDTRASLRRFFEVNRAHVAVAALYELSRRGTIDGEVVTEAIRRYGVDPDATDPRLS